MARQMVVLAFVFVFVAFVGLVSAADTAKAPAAATPQSSAASPDAGTSGTSPSSSPLADPMSPPSPTGESTVAGPTTAGAPAPGKSGATTLKVSSVVVGVAVIAGFFVY